MAQDNYEIQVYASPTMAKGSTMVELHSNFVFNGEKNTIDGVYPTHHLLHETVEITHGWTDWFETGFYFFNSIGDAGRTAYVGSHIRPRVMAPTKWHWPVGASLSMEVGYQSPKFDPDDWTLEIRPIVDKQLNKFYLALNPTFDKSLHGLNKNQGYIFSPNFKGSYNFTKIIAGGVEYYGSLGPLNHFFPYQQQGQQLFAAVDLEWSPDWEVNFGYGWGLTQSTDKSIFKLILGYRFH
ncbi:MAG: hypothetical protein J7539_11115 [Niabella sp.]|nr:hypothetical protein [Niabella sp.]